jgi:hypothetical protein
MIQLEDKINSDQKRNSNERTLPVKIFRERYSDARDVGAAVKFVEAKPGKSGSLSRVTSRRIAGSQRELVIYTDPSNFGRVNSSGVISTWSRRRPSMDLLSRFSAPTMKSDWLSESNRSGISNIDRNDLFPTNANFIERINNGGAFIKDDYFGAEENQPCAKAEQTGPEQGCDATLNRKVEKTLRGVNASGDKDNSSEDNSASRTKTLWISHPSIISWSEQR